MKVLIAAIHHWYSPFQVGTHAIAREFLRRGWDVAYVSAPLTPLHRFKPQDRDLVRRRQNHYAGGEYENGGKLWHYVPYALAAPDNRPLLSNAFLLRKWFRLSCPDLLHLVCERGFGSVELLFLDSLYQSFWLDHLDYARSAFRMADNNAGFSGYSSACRHVESRIAQKVDRVFISAEKLRTTAETMKARAVELLPNGVNLERFAGPLPNRPEEYRTIPGPIAVYVGAFGPWFDFELLGLMAARLSFVSFVLIGPENTRIRELATRHPNVHPLGIKPAAEVPAYLRHADAGIIPFNAREHPELVNSINPLKLYEYAASGLPIVSTDWEELHRLPLEFHRCVDAQGFSEALASLVRNKSRAPAHNAQVLRELDWSHQLAGLFAWAGEAVAQ